jgi:putative IMPACT (imprinted ancient) family translation regulator
MLEALKHSGLSNICVCTVRYFGGIKLGPAV